MAILTASFQLATAQYMGNVGSLGETGAATLEETLQLARDKVIAPLKQIAQGVLPSEVICNEGLQLIMRNSGSSACVRMDTAIKLEERGWGVMNQVPEPEPEPEVAQPIPEPEYPGEESTDFAKSKKSVLSDLVKIQQSHNFDIVFDKDLTSKQKEGAIFHTYKIVHETDGRIGDLTFYFGKPYFLMFPPTDFDKIFRVKIFISNEYGVVPTSAALPIIKSSLEELVPEWNMINKDQTSSDWIDDIIQYGQSDSSGEKNETIRSDQQEIKFAYNEEGLGFAELIITQKIS